MKNIYYLFTVSVLLFAASLCGCEDMDENYKKYLEEYSYSGKISNLRYYQGFERIILAWDNPKDQKSKTILIRYDIDNKEKAYDHLIDSVSVDGLDSGSGYDFTVHTVDNAGNLSVPVTVSALPVTQSFLNNLTPPTCTVANISGDGPEIRFTNLSTITMRYAGKVTYRITGPGGFVRDGEIIREVSPKEEVFECTAPIEELLPNTEYQIEYTTNVWPIVGKTVTVDQVEVKGSSLLRLTE